MDREVGFHYILYDFLKENQTKSSNYLHNFIKRWAGQLNNINLMLVHVMAQFSISEQALLKWSVSEIKESFKWNTRLNSE